MVFVSRWLARAIGMLTVAGACSADSAEVGTLGTSSGTTGGAETTGGRSEDDAADAPSTSSTSSTDTGSGGTADCSSADPAACPEGCAVVQAWSIHDDNCGANPVDVCVALGGAPDVVPTTFWNDGPDGPRFVEVAMECGIDAQPTEGWRECGTGDGEPIACACFCAQGLCAGDADRLALEACGFVESCPTVSVDTLSGSVDVRAEQCVLEALADRDPGVYEWSGSNGFGGARIRFHVDESGVQIISWATGDVPSCPTTSGWRPASRCELASPEYFTMCLDLLGTEQDCAFTPELWTTGCTETPPTCPR